MQFTRESAERIASVVRTAEVTPQAASPLTFDKRFPERMPKQVRAATFSGAWPIGSSKTVTFKYLPTATATVVNLSWPITLDGYVNEDCVVGREGTSWWLVVPKLEERTAVFVTQTQSFRAVTSTAVGTYASAVQAFSAITDIQLSAELNTNNCEITVSKTVHTTEVRVVSATATAVFASGTTTIPIASQTATSVYLRIRVP